MNSLNVLQKSYHGKLYHLRATSKSSCKLRHVKVSNEDELIFEKKLFLAVLERGIRDFLSPSSNHYLSAKMWLYSHEEEYPFSFKNICKMLGYDSEILIEKLKELRKVAKKRKRSSREIYRIISDIKNSFAIPSV
ncbi:MAG: hypothetical protein N2654_06150 [Deltaproteobacteria bacterium]|nr:hypothetical protein [Deltaproteobacteria bacterium]